jgi:hypothetical protein
MLFQKLYRCVLWTGIASLMVACGNPSPVASPAPAPVQATVKAQPPPPPASPLAATPPNASNADTPREYRRDGAIHLYAKYGKRVFPGKMPPLLYAIGVLQVDINAKGAVTGLRWMRAPKHAPEVVAEIERSVRAAAPFPAPVKLGRVTYTDTWLWDKSGRFQLDTLTEGQL